MGRLPPNIQIQYGAPSLDHALRKKKLGKWQKLKIMYIVGVIHEIQIFNSVSRVQAFSVG